MNKKIMVIENEKRIADAIAYALKKEGYTAQAVYHMGGALEKLQDFCPHAIIHGIGYIAVGGYCENQY